MKSRSNDIERGDYLAAQAILLVSRLERISADSIWAHRSSGNRGELLKWIEIRNENSDDQSLDRLDALIQSSYKLLEEAAREMVK
jgi:hypothetical protein